MPSRQKSRERSYRKDTTRKMYPPFFLVFTEKVHFIIGHATGSPQNIFYVYGPVNWPMTNDFISRGLLKQATKKKNERFITRRFGVLMTPLPSEMWIILQSSHLLHLLDCNIIHTSLDNGVMGTSKRRVIHVNLSFFFLITNEYSNYPIQTCILFFLWEVSEI